MATHQGAMRVNVVYASGYQLPDLIQPDTIKNIGPTWGSWTTWTKCATDNVICHDLVKARELLRRSVQSACNFYLPQKFYQPVQRPEGIHFYQGDFQQETLELEDIIAMHLASGSADLVLLLGFDLAKPQPIDDRYQRHRVTNRLGLIRQCMMSCDQIQWVLVDHDAELDPAFQNLPNLSCDKMPNVLHLLTQ
jgi:hypothetical protein